MAQRRHRSEPTPTRDQTHATEHAGRAQHTAHQVVMMRQMHEATLWVHMVNVALGLWLITSPFAFGYFGTTSFPDSVQAVTAERGLAPAAARLAWLGWSDVVSGSLILLLGLLSLSPRQGWAQWGNAAIGLWLLFAPLMWFAPTPFAYANDTLVGTMVIAFAVVVPMMPGMDHEAMMRGPEIPPGWEYCPSTYLQRLPVIVLAVIGFLISRYLTAYQLGHIDHAWDPFFDPGTEHVITSDVSRAWPIADAGLGAVTYILEALMAIMGGKKRWRTMPWMVLGFIVVVVPLGVVSIVFIIIQPIMIGTWCSLCLLAALAMLIMIPYAIDELVAMAQFMADARRAGLPLWRTFWRGGVVTGEGPDRRPSFAAPLAVQAREGGLGVAVPWTLAASTLIGVWLMFTRLIYGSAGAMADSDHLIGSLAVTVSVIAWADVARPLRLVNFAFGLWLIVAPWLLDGAGPGATVGSIVAGLLLAALSMPRGRLSVAQYGGYERWIV